MDTLDTINAKTQRAYDLAAQRYHDLFHDEMNEKAYDRALLDAFAARFDPGAVICDAGCGPSAHIGRYVGGRGLQVVGVDISRECVALARRHNPGMLIERGDIGALPFAAGTLDGVIAYYSIIDTPRRYASRLFDEFRRVLKPGGYLLVAVKAGDTEGYVPELLGLPTEIYFTLFREDEIAAYCEASGFALEFIETRNPYDFEIANERIFAIGRRSAD